ncbi:cellulase family glycosylhydrolase [Brevundimonas sp.]|uniref:GH39 family glycosyl hydrolase n=1 Tax=Brevundimonas sp. TaxID=1871086 RepID=UPI0025BD1C1F|nr:cellulase family glycosylhydrolase [Brevundimonas sp.]
MKWCGALAALAAAGLMLVQTPCEAAVEEPDAASGREITVDLNAPARPRDRMALHSVGADYPGVTGRDDALAQLRIVRDELGFDYIRFHAIFHDDMGVYREVDGRPVYDFSRIDRLYDRFLEMGIRPFIELGFTPHDMRTSDQTLFYWQGNTSHPDPEKWEGLIDAFVRHLIARYGAEEVRRWYFEFWNEPNLDGFWENADQAAYFDHYALTVRTIKAINPALRVGGPSTAGAAWVPELLAYAEANDLPVDFITTHTYGVAGGFLDEFGHDDNMLLTTPDSIIADVRNVRAQIEASHRPGLPLYFTEWSASYNPRDPVHDSHISASFILTKTRQAEGLAQNMSYWAFSDLFEEPGPQTLPFQGGFGLMNPQGVRKPAWFAYKYLNALGDQELEGGDDQTIITRDQRGVQVLAWIYEPPRDQDVSNRPYFGRVHPSPPAAPLVLRFEGLAPGDHAASVRRVGFRHNDAYTAWLEMGSPETLDESRLVELHDQTRDDPELMTVRADANGRAVLTLPMAVHDVILVELETAR